uniref:Fucolectin tachylectin-4 pentraxin-1 domain-containing protein n=2 Tax=Magallana gigas TaxID=29159 RepID=A0A8W8LZM6_MAGGI
MILVLLALALVCVFHDNLVLSNSNDELTNVAYSKSVRLSSYTSIWYNGFYAVNGMFSDYIHTLVEKSPWLRIDLGARYQIHEIEVFARSDCCGYQLHDVDFRVGMKIHKMHLCGHFTGHASTGQRIVVFCPSNTTGRYVQLQIVAGNSNYLTSAEVLVWGKHVY